MDEARVSAIETQPSQRYEDVRRQVYQLADLSEYSLKQRVVIRTAGWLLWCLIGLISRTVRWTVIDWHQYEQIERAGQQIIFTFWHQCIFSATWFWRRRGIVVMTSRSADGEIIARIIQRFGYGAARGSSSQGAGAALRQMATCMRAKIDTAFTIDGPRGPRFVAKPGAVRLVKMTRQAILPFHISAKRRWQLKSWDLFQIPQPFTEAVVLLGKPICVATGRNDEIAERQAELQATLDELRERGERWWSDQSSH